MKATTYGKKIRKPNDNSFEEKFNIVLWRNIFDKIPIQDEKKHSGRFSFLYDLHNLLILYFKLQQCKAHYGMYVDNNGTWAQSELSLHGMKACICIIYTYQLTQNIWKFHPPLHKYGSSKYLGVCKEPFFECDGCPQCSLTVAV